MNIPGLTAPQQSNAATIVSVAKAEFSDPKQQRQAAIIGIITALTESGLVNTPHGDRDSVGLFQQRSSWGSVQQRMDPTTSAQLFFNRLKTVKGWDTMDPGAAAQAVQVSAFPDRYDTHLNTAGPIVSALLGGSVSIGPVSQSTTTDTGKNLFGIPNDLFTPQFWTRVGVGVLGTILLLIAFVALLKNSDAGTAVVNTVKGAI